MMLKRWLHWLFARWGPSEPSHAQDAARVAERRRVEARIRMTERRLSRMEREFDQFDGDVRRMHRGRPGR